MSDLPPPLNAHPGKHRHIAEVLRERILSGACTGKLPSYDVLTAEFAVTRVTLSKAIHSLEQAGLVTPAGTRGVLINRLRRPRSRRIAVAVQSWDGPLMTSMLVGARRMAERTRHEVILADTRNEPARVIELIDDLYRGEHVDGMIIGVIAHVGDEQARLVQALTDAQVPAVLVLDPDPRICATVHTVVIPDLSRAVVQHLIAQGCRRILAVADTDSVGTDYLASRLQTWRETLGEAQLSAPEPVILPHYTTAPTRAGSAALHAALLAADGVFCATDQAALRILAFCLETGIQVPGRLLVAGYDDVHAARQLGLTTVKQPFDQVGEVAVDLLIQDIEGRLPQAEHRLVTPTLHLRRTTARGPGLGGADS